MFDVVAGETGPACRRQETGKKEEIIEINKIYLPFTSRGIFSIIFNLIYLLRFRKGIFHITGDVHYALLVLPKDRTVLTIHDLVFMHTYKGIRKAILKWIFLDMPVRRAKYITTISEKSKQEIIDFTECDGSKILVIPNPVGVGKEARREGGSEAIGNSQQAVVNDVEHSDSHLTSFNDQSSFKYNSPCLPASLPPCLTTPSTLLFLGTKQNKNLNTTIAALFGLDVHLRIIGKMDEAQLELLDKFKINYSNAFHLSDEELHQEYEQADIVLFPSTYEGFGLPIIEGFQSNTPVITSNIPPMSDVAQGAALLVDPFSIDSIRDGVQQLMHDEKLQYELIAKGNEVVKQYHPSSIAVRYANLWQKLDQSHNH